MADETNWCHIHKHLIELIERLGARVSDLEKRERLSQIPLLSRDEWVQGLEAWGSFTQAREQHRTGTERVCDHHDLDCTYHQDRDTKRCKACGRSWHKDWHQEWVADE